MTNKEETMAVMLRCADSGADCPFTVTTEKESELMEHVKVHMQSCHPEMAKNPPSPEMIKKMIHKV